MKALCMTSEKRTSVVMGLIEKLGAERVFFSIT